MQDALQRVTALCAAAEHCCHDIREKLQRWGIADEDAEEVIAYLLHEKYIDEERYSIAYCRDKMRYNHWGRVKIDQGLRMLGIDSQNRRTGLEALPEEEYYDILVHILESKQQGIKARNAYEKRGKLIRFALGRGFEMSLIQDCLPESLDDE